MSSVFRDVTLILASGSPRRQSLLRALTPRLCIMIPDADESVEADESPASLVRRLSLAKAEAVLQRLLTNASAGDEGKQTCIVAADTVVVAPGAEAEILGKPQDKDQALQMLRRLRGKQHRVYTGLAILELDGPCRSQVEAVATPVIMRAYSEEQIAAYVATGDPLDKAGAYAIQHPHFAPVARFEGCYANVMGLPLCHLERVLAAWGYGLATHPLEACPYPQEHAGKCPWAATILAHEG